MNWQTIFAQIQSFGLSQNDIAARLGKSQAWASAVSQGKYIDLRWADGQALIALLDEVTAGQSAPVNPEIAPISKSREVA